MLNSVFCCRASPNVVRLEFLKKEGKKKQHKKKKRADSMSKSWKARIRTVDHVDTQYSLFVLIIVVSCHNARSNHLTLQTKQTEKRQKKRSPHRQVKENSHDSSNIRWKKQRCWWCTPSSKVIGWLKGRNTIYTLSPVGFLINVTYSNTATNMRRQLHKKKKKRSQRPSPTNRNKSYI